MNRDIKIIDVENITTNPHQPRLQFEDESISELANSIEENGLIQPITVRKTFFGYELVAGERRLRATRYLGKKFIEAIVQDYDDQASAKVAIIENIQRENLSPIEEAIAYQKLLEDHNYTQGDLAKSLGKSQSTIANKIRLLNLDDSVKKQIMEKKITERHGRALLKISDPIKQSKALDKILSDNLNVSQSEKYIEKVNNGGNDNKPIRKKIMSKHDCRLEVTTIKQSVSLIEKAGVNVSMDIKESNDGVEVIIKMKK